MAGFREAEFFRRKTGDAGPRLPPSGSVNNNRFALPFVPPVNPCIAKFETAAAR